VLANRYVVQAALGRGGSGAVYRAWDSQLECPIAIKIHDALGLAPSESVRSMTREVRLARRVRHPNVCPVYDLVRADGHWFTTMELAATTMYAANLEGARPTDAKAWRRAVEDAVEVTSGLTAIHACGITHGDLTPRNILRMTDGRLAVTDFGMARHDADSTRLCGGTLNYLAPEVMLGGAPERRSDVWQLGLVLHELLLGPRLRWRLQDTGPVAERPPERDLPEAATTLLDVAAACLTWTPERRPPDARAVLDALEDSLSAAPRPRRRAGAPARIGLVK
jgi:serine/threonine-protein kinase